MMLCQLKNKSKLTINTQSIVFIVSLLFLLPPLKAQNSHFQFESEGMKLKLEQVTSGLNIPWGMVFLSPTKIILTEREGQILLFNLVTKRKTPLKNIPTVMAEGQGGLLDVALPPNYKTTGWIYFTYVKDIDGEGATTLARAKLVKDRFISWQELLVSDSTSDTGRHFGSRITFDGKGHVFFGIGDRGERPNAQDLTNHAGSIIRLNLDGSVPDDNPFVNNKNVMPEIWSYGHRNPQGLTYDTKTARLWEIEHGPRGGDEINLIKAGANYGWPVISYGKEYWGPVAVGEGTHRQGMEQPVKVYIPSIAPGSLLIYTGNAYPEWKGNLFSGALKLHHINRIVLSEDGQEIKEERLLEDLNERIRALAQSPQGWIYFSTDNGNIFRIISE